MKAFRKLFVAAAVAAATAAISLPANAQDYSRYNWGGLYFGGHVGGAWTDTNWSWDLPTLGASQRVSASDNDFARGIQLGFQHQWGNIVAGIEVSTTSLHTKDSQVINFVSGFDRNFRTDVRSLVLVDARLGYAFGSWLGYIKGGYANADVELQTVRTMDGLLQTRSRDREDGWNVGGGIEYAIMPSVILGVDYTYVDLGTKNRLDVNQVGTIQSNHTGIDAQIQTVTARLSFKLGRAEERYESMK